MKLTDSETGSAIPRRQILSKEFRPFLEPIHGVGLSGLAISRRNRVSAAGGRCRMTNAVSADWETDRVGLRATDRYRFYCFFATTMPGAQAA